MADLEHPLVRGYRELLCVAREATPGEIKRAFREMAKLYHPDVNPDPDARRVFMEMRRACEVLQDEDEVRRLNDDYREGRFQQRLVRGRDLRLGRFFGHRFVREPSGGRDAGDYDWAKGPPKLVVTGSGGWYYEAAGSQEISILDHPQLDLVEVILAGRLELDDTRRLAEAFRRKDFNALPWFILNNEGVVAFLSGRYEEALACYDRLNRRVPENIVFLFRLGLCHEVLAFRNAVRRRERWSGVKGADVRKAIRCYRQAIRLGEVRPYMPQKCMSIRKTLADLLSITGRRLLAWRVWKGIRQADPTSREAARQLARSRPAIAGLLTDGRGGRS